MASTRALNWRPVALVGGFALLGWVGFEIGRAGGDIAPPRIAQPSMLVNGNVSGKRIDGRSWSLDYDTVSMAPDGTSATIAHVKHGRIHRKGKPDVTFTATDVTVNTVTNDLMIGGPVDFHEPVNATRARTFRTVGARYIGATRTLVLDHPATITDAGAVVTVASARIDFRSGDASLGRIMGTRPGNLR